MKRKIHTKSILLILLLIIICSSCSINTEDLPKVTDAKIEKVNFSSTTDIVIALNISVENSKNKTYAIKKLEGQLYRKDKHFANIVLKEPIKVEPLYLGLLTAKFDIKILDAKSAIMLALGGFDNLNPDDFTLSLQTTAKAGLFKKKFKIEKYPVQNILKEIQ